MHNNTETAVRMTGRTQNMRSSAQCRTATRLPPTCFFWTCDTSLRARADGGPSG